MPTCDVSWLRERLLDQLQRTEGDKTKLSHDGKKRRVVLVEVNVFWEEANSQKEAEREVRRKLGKRWTNSTTEHGITVLQHLI